MLKATNNATGCVVKLVFPPFAPMFPSLLIFKGGGTGGAEAAATSLKFGQSVPCLSSKAAKLRKIRLFVLTLEESLKAPTKIHTCT